jgi:hypothetical protein
MKPTYSLTKLLALGLLVTGCKNLDKFNTEENEAYCGSLVSPADASEGFDYWTTQHQELKLAVTLNTDRLDDLPGNLRSNDADFGPCAPQPLFDDAPLRVIKKALGDRIASIRLGDDHEDEILAYVDSTCSGTMFAILSLVQNGTTELRLLRPAPEVLTPVADQPRFGVFQLSKRNTTTNSACSF